MPFFTKRNLFRLLAIFTMGSVYLPVVFNKVPFPFHTPTIYLALWVFLIAVFHTRILYSKSLLLIYLFIAIYLLFSVLFWSGRTMGSSVPINILWIYKETCWLFLAILMSTYFIKRTDYFGFGLVTAVSLAFITVTSISSILGLSIYPDALRMISLDENAKKLGIGNFGFFAGVVFLTPVIASYVKNSTISKKIKMIFMGLALINIYAIAQAQYATSLILAVLFFVITIVANIRNYFRLSISISVFLFLFLFIFNHQFANGIYFLADLMPGTVLESRLSDFALAIKLSDFDPGSNSTYLTSERLSRSYSSFSSFLENPIIGDGQSAGHAYWLDRLAMFGLLGIIPWFLVFRDQIKKNTRLFSRDYKQFYMLSFSAFILFGLVKGGLNSPQTMVSFFFLVPGMFFIRDLKKVVEKPVENYNIYNEEENNSKPSTLRNE